MAVAGVAAAVFVAEPRWQEHVAPPAVTAPSLEALPPSLLTLSIVYEASPLIDELERAVPLRIGNISRRLAHPSDPLIRYAYQADRSPFEVELRDDFVVLTTVIEYGGQVWYATPLGLDLTASCGASPTRDGRLRAIVTFSSPIDVAEDWTVRPRVSIDRVAPLSAEDRCLVGAFGLSLDVTDAIMAEAERQLQAEADRIHRVLAGIDVRPHVEEYWQVVREPIALGEDAWLTLEPRSLRYDGIEATGPDGRYLRTRVSALARPRIVLGARPEPFEAPFPPLERGPARSSEGALVDGFADYEGLSELLTRELHGESFEVAGRALQVRTVAITAAGAGRLSVDLDVEGGMEGRIHLTGTPVFDPVEGEVSFPDLDFRVESGSLFARAYGWILRNAFPQRVRDQARVAVDARPVLERALAEAAAGDPRRRGRSEGRLELDLGGMAQLEGTVTGLELVGVVVTAEGLLLRSRIDASTTVRVGGMAEE